MLADVVDDYGTAFWLSWAKCLEGQLLVLRGDFADGVRLLRSGIATRERAGWMMRNPEFLGSLAVGLAGEDRLPEASAAVDEALAQSARDAQRWCVPDLLRIRGELLLQTDNGDSIAAAGALLAQAMEEARRQQALFFELRAATSLARLLARQGQPRQARQQLGRVYDRFSEGFSALDLCDAKALLASLDAG
jgi:predicted ATPase